MDPSILGAGGSADPMIRRIFGRTGKDTDQEKNAGPGLGGDLLPQMRLHFRVAELTLGTFDVTSANDEIGAGLCSCGFVTRPAIAPGVVPDRSCCVRTGSWTI